MTMTAPNQHEHLFFLSAELGGETLATQLTAGEWNVSTSGINVDTRNKLIYFQGKIFVRFVRFLYVYVQSCTFCTHLYTFMLFVHFVYISTFCTFLYTFFTLYTNRVVVLALNKIFRKYGLAPGKPLVFYLVRDQNGSTVAFNP